MPALQTFCEGMDRKTKQRMGLALLTLEMTLTDGSLNPAIKHFQMKCYSGLHEFRTKIGAKMVRVIFTYWRDGKILLLTPFYKTQPRDTEGALDKALKMLAEVKAGESTVKDLPIEQFGDQAGKR